MLFSVLLLIGFLPFLGQGACNYLCATCVNPSGYYGRLMCTSCYSGYILSNYYCLDCSSCDYYGICDQCSPQSSSNPASSSINMYSIIFGTLAGVTFLCLLTVFIYYKFCRRSPPADGAMQASVAQLAPLPSALSWKKADHILNIGENCAICLESNVTSETKCGHLYHPSCIWEWCSKREVSCPLCKSNQVDPVQLFCQKCLSASIEIPLASFPHLRDD